MSEAKKTNETNDGVSAYFLNGAEALAFEAMKEIKAYFAYQGNDSKPLNRAKIAATMISSYARMQASQTNRMAVDLAIKKFGLELPLASKITEGQRIAVLEPGEPEQQRGKK